MKKRSFNVAFILVILFISCSISFAIKNKLHQEYLEGQLYSQGTASYVTILKADAGYSSDIFYEVNGVRTNIGNSKDDVGKVVVIPAYPSGTEIVFGISVRNTGEVFKTGPANRNKDNFSHNKLWLNNDGTITVGFEDLLGGGDKDYNDALINVRSLVRVTSPQVLKNCVGGMLYAIGNSVQLTVGISNAGYTSKIGYINSQGTRTILTENVKLDINKSYTIPTKPEEAVDVFIYVINTNKYWFTGPASRNSDNFNHARVIENGNNAVTVGFEDLEGGGDKDYDDVLFTVRGVSVNCNPVISVATPAPAPVPVPAPVPELKNCVGGMVYALGESVELTVGPSNAGYTNIIGYVNAQGLKTPIANAKTDTNKIFTLQTKPGEAVDVYIFVTNTNKYWFTGPASRNSDNFNHARVTERGNNSVTMGFEDLEGGGDKDFDDVLFTLKGVSVNCNPVITQPAPVPVPVLKNCVGGMVYASGESVQLTVGISNAGYTNIIGYVNSQGVKIPIANAKTDTNKSFTIPTKPGDAVDVYIFVTNINKFWFTGPAARNSDNFNHARVVEKGNNVVSIEFEDLEGGGDKDFDDVQFVLNGVSVNCSPIITLPAPVPAPVPPPAPKNCVGGMAYASGDSVQLTVGISNAGYTSHIGYVNSQGVKTTLANAKTDTNKSFTIPTKPGQSVDVYIYVTNTNKYWFTGPGSRNSDKLFHARVVEKGNTVASVEFEDLEGGGDKDYDDVVFTLNGVNVNCEPIINEPVPEPTPVLKNCVGGMVYSKGSTVQITVGPSNAAYTNIIGYVNSQGVKTPFANAKLDTNKSFTIPTNPGHALDIYIYVTNTNKYWFTGPAFRNTDNFNHARVSEKGNNVVSLGFEDLEGGGDKDFDDVQLTISGVDANCNPIINRPRPIKPTPVLKNCVGGMVYAKGKSVKLTVGPSLAGYTNLIGYVNAQGGKTTIANAKTDTNKTFTIPTKPGEAIDLYIFVTNTNKHWFTGPASRNSDGFMHAKVEEKGNSVVSVGFEDLEGGGDKDFDDVLFTISGVRVNCNPVILRPCPN